MNNENIEEILKNIGEEEIPADVHKIAQETSNNFSNSIEQIKQPKQLILLEQIMKSKITKLAVAAMIFIAVLAGIPLLSPQQGIALGDVLAKIEQVRAFMYRMEMTMQGSIMPGRPDRKQEIQGTITISTEYGMKWQMDMTDPNTGKTMTQQMYIIPDQKVMISLMPEQKKFMRMEFNDDLLTRMKKQNNDPREMMKQIMACEYTELGRSEIDGIEVEGFETTDPKFSAGMAKDVKVKLWVDVKTWLPVLWEMDMTMNEMSMHGVISDFQWDVPVVASDFEPVIPEDYTTLTKDGFKMPAMTEQAAIEGLKFFVEIFGRYPGKIDMINLMKEFSALKSDVDLTEAGLKLREEMKQIPKGQNAIKEMVAKRMEIMKPVQSLGMFYTMLVQDDKDPVYYGSTVGPEDAGAVLLRWKVSDSEYHIIFGDLSVGDATADELIDLEKSAIDDGNKTSDITEETAFEGTDKSTATDHYERGDTHYFNGEYDQAFSELTKAIEKDPDLACAYVTRGMAYNDKNEFDLAIADFTKLIEIKPMDAHAYAYRGMAYVNKGEYDLAVADCSRAIEIDPTLTDPYRLRARAYTYKGEYDKAWKDVYQAQALGQPVDSRLLEKLRKASGRNE